MELGPFGHRGLHAAPTCPVNLGLSQGTGPVTAPLQPTGVTTVPGTVLALALATSGCVQSQVFLKTVKARC